MNDKIIKKNEWQWQKNKCKRWARSLEVVPERSWYLEKSRFFSFPFENHFQSWYYITMFQTRPHGLESKQGQHCDSKEEDWSCCCRGAASVERWRRGRQSRTQTVNHSSYSNGQSGNPLGRQACQDRGCEDAKIMPAAPSTSLVKGLESF